jgi:hypothetical protein
MLGHLLVVLVRLVLELFETLLALEVRTFELFLLEPHAAPSLVDLFPPLAPPVAADQDSQLRVPAVRELVVRVQIEQAVVA